MEKEFWKNIPRYANQYQVSTSVESEGIQGWWTTMAHYV